MHCFVERSYKIAEHSKLWISVQSFEQKKKNKLWNTIILWGAY